MSDIKTLSIPEQRTCSQAGCGKPAIYSYVWTDYMYACEEHMQSALRISKAMGFPTPERTVRLLVLDTTSEDDESSTP